MEATKTILNIQTLYDDQIILNFKALGKFLMTGPGRIFVPFEYGKVNDELLVKIILPDRIQTVWYLETLFD